MRLAGALVLAGCGFHHGEVAGGDAPIAIDARAIDARAIDARAIDGGAPIDAAQGPIVIEAEAYTSETPTASHQWTSETAVAGYTGTSYMQITPDDGAACPDPTQLATCATWLAYDVALAQSATLFFQVRMYATTTADDSLWYSVDGVVDTTPIQPPHDSAWHWNVGASHVLAAGTHVLAIWQREAGARADAIALTPTTDPPP
ncbi:MAG TPA: hypothetical protein VLX92_19255 [Kofleriaceae bacterium]|nr:hypothetical protein [Kofleriaceae bacterium]